MPVASPMQMTVFAVGPWVAAVVAMAHVLLFSHDGATSWLYREWFALAANLQTTCVSTLDQARSVLEAPGADIVLMDVTSFEQWNDCGCLGGMAAAPPVVVLTGWVTADGRFRQRAFDAGCAAFVAKPCHPRVLVAVLRRVLDGARHIAVT
jgi:DNA-binding response OmpR family regulator